MGGYIRKDGYKTIWLTEFKKRVFEHRYVMEQFLNRTLNSNETIHHINHNRLDNSIENLEILSRSEHTSKYHRKKFINRTLAVCKMCKRIFPVKNKNYRGIYCSLECRNKGNILYNGRKGKRNPPRCMFCEYPCSIYFKDGKNKGYRKTCNRHYVSSQAHI